jgi:hypothetical protein
MSQTYSGTDLDKDIELKLRELLKVSSWNPASNQQKYNAFDYSLANSKIKTTNESINIHFTGQNSEKNLYNFLELLVSAGIESPDIFSDKNNGKNTKIVNEGRGILYLRIDPYSNTTRTDIFNKLCECVEWIKDNNQHDAIYAHEQSVKWSDFLQKKSENQVTYLH